MNRCPLTYRLLPPGTSYAPEGLRALHPSLRTLAPLPFTASKLRQEAAARADKMSVGGVQPKVSAVLDLDESTGEGAFRVVDRGGRYLLKPPPDAYPEVPANEDLTMRLARLAGVETPWHGLVRTSDGDLCYAIRRFDRSDDGSKLAVEDVGQLMGLGRDAKYDASMRDLAHTVLAACTIPRQEAIRLFRLVLVNYLVGNEDGHLRNFSVLTLPTTQVVLAPAYDVLNSTIVLRNAQEEIALTVANAKSGLQRSDLLWYLGEEQMGLPKRTVKRLVAEVERAQSLWDDLLDRSLLSPAMQARYREVLAARRAVLFA